MNSSLLSGQAAMPLIKGIHCLLSAERGRELIALLATEGKLVKRPLLVGPDFVLVGFREEQWQEKLLGR